MSAPSGAPSSGSTPEVLPLPRRGRGAERARGVQRRTGQRPERDGGQADRGGDGEHGGRADGAGVGRDAHDDQHEQRGEDHSDDERPADGNAGDGRAEVRGTRGPDDEQQQRGEGRAGELRRPVGAEVAGRQVPGKEEPEADAGVEVRSADMTEGGDGGEENEEEHQVIVR